MTKVRFVAVVFACGSLLSACGSAGESTGSGEEGVWPEPKPANAKLMSTAEGDAPTEENQCLGPNYCTGSVSNCCSHNAWWIGVSGCYYACCLPNGWSTAGGEQCCSGRAHYYGSSLVCY